ncbi:MAG: CCA tRNA nucleotidyltransferase [Planctomycetota bacterium]|jgi:tRNA nucleotidyltransferase/poly(A) polymerase
MTNRQAAIKTVKRLRSSGFEALFAGGCVRDMLLGRPAKDFDVATDAQPNDVMKIFRRTLKVGAKFGVVIVLIEGEQVEVATFRTEADYADGRHPGIVDFADAAEDARRRDFTINGMFYDPIERRVIDYVNGRADLKSGIIRTIGVPKERFGEDYLRMLRAVRFSTQLGFKIEPATRLAICRSVDNITKISGERIAAELEGILVNPNRAGGTALLIETGLAEVVFGGFVGRQAKSAVSVLGQLRKKIDFALALAGFFAGCKTQFALDKCRTLKLSRNQTKHVKFLLANRGKLLDEQMSLGPLKMILAEPYFWDLYELQKAIGKATGPGRRAIAPLIKLRRRIRALGDIELKPKRLLNGHDLMRLGAVAGPSLGQLSEEMYIAQLEGTLKTTKQAERWTKEWLDKHKKLDNSA